MGTMKSFNVAEDRPHTYEEILEGLVASNWDWLESMAQNSKDLETLNRLGKALVFALQGLDDSQSDSASGLVGYLEKNPLYLQMDQELKEEWEME